VKRTPSMPPLSRGLRSTTLRFRRSLRIATGVRLNLGLHGVGLSVGPRGLHVGVNRTTTVRPTRSTRRCKARAVERF
jgi:Protein of unknown function (DUF4236)